MKNFAICSILSILSSCGDKSTSDLIPEPELRCLCTPSTNFLLISPEAFPEKMKLTFKHGTNERILVDECSPKPTSDVDFKIERSLDSGFIEGTFTGLIRENVGIEITDLGSDCTNDGIFYKSDTVDKQITVLSNDPMKPDLESLVIKL